MIGRQSLYPTSEFLGLLIKDEKNNRRTNNYKKGYSKAGLPAYKNIEDFDFFSAFYR